MRPAIEVRGLAYNYGARRALDGVDFAVAPGSIFGLLGPNGGGKTTLFRILSTLLPIQSGSAEVLGFDLARQPNEIRRHIGVTFQSPSIDPKLTVAENLRHQGHLYGLSGRALADRIGLLTAKLGLEERLNELAETLSGGLKRRVEIAKGLLHRPQALLSRRAEHGPRSRRPARFVALLAGTERRRGGHGAGDHAPDGRGRTLRQAGHSRPRPLSRPRHAACLAGDAWGATT